MPPKTLVCRQTCAGHFPNYSVKNTTLLACAKEKELWRSCLNIKKRSKHAVRLVQVLHQRRVWVVDGLHDCATKEISSLGNVFGNGKNVFPEPL